jgi:hypothetical protein
MPKRPASFAKRLKNLAQGARDLVAKRKNKRVHDKENVRKSLTIELEAAYP